MRSMGRQNIPIAFCVLLTLQVSNSHSIISKRHIDRACELSQGKFGCDDGHCIDKGNVCDGFSNCPDGSDENLVACKCGVSSVGNINGRGRASKVQSTRDYPWHVTIYFLDVTNKEKLLCSGVLINKKYVLTAASCLYDKDRRTFLSTRSLKVATGKLKKIFKSNEPNHKIFEVETVLDANFKLHYYSGNLALVQLKESVDLSKVSPICLWPKDKEPPGSVNATFTGWDLHFETKQPYSNAVLHQVKLEYLSDLNCKQKFKSSLIHQYVKFDKGCLIPEQGIGVSVDDIGGPVIVKQNQRHYLLGIVANSIPSERSIIVVTDVIKRMEWIYESMSRNPQAIAGCGKDYFECEGKCVPKSKRCDCPEYLNDENCKTKNVISISLSGEKACPKNSNAIFTPQNCTKDCNDEFRAPSNAQYTVSCPANTSFDDDQIKIDIVCIGGKWFPSLPVCKSTCYLEEQKSLVLVCEYRGEELEQCKGVLKRNTKIKVVRCAAGYKKRIDTPNVSEFICDNGGEFSRSMPQCTPVCGKLNEAGRYVEPLIQGGKISKQGKFPWYVALFWKNSTDGEISFKCGGTLISSNMVLTAAHCVHDNKNRVRPEFMLVAAATFNIQLGEDPLQKTREVKNVFVKNSYRSQDNKFLEDIAILELSHDLPLSTYIMPACLNDASVPPPKDGDTGYLAGFGYTIDDGARKPEPSNFLKETNLTYLSYAKCKDSPKVNQAFKEFILPDKFCTTTTEKNPGIPLRGDSGGGLTFENNGLHYVTGIVSVRSTKVKDISVFTNVTYYMKWIRSHVKL